jgi:hypothetical protein
VLDNPKSHQRTPGDDFEYDVWATAEAPFDPRFSGDRGKAGEEARQREAERQRRELEQADIARKQLYGQA